VVKTPVGEPETVALEREYNNYKNSDIALSPYIRTLYDAVGFFEEKVIQDNASTEDPVNIEVVCACGAIDIFKTPNTIHSYR